MKRQIKLDRKTAETTVRVRLDLDGSGKCDAQTGVGFLDHMLHSLAFHACFDLTLRGQGDTHVDDHHITEDVGITLGEAFRKSLGEARGIRRFGFAVVPMDEALAMAAVDLSGRFHFESNLEFKRIRLGDLTTEMINHFFRSFAENAKLNLHLTMMKGQNDHHKAEVAFKAVGLALSQAVEINPKRVSRVPSAKEVI
ncbi:MAG: imidazoleglycerol-phosphate dehydratase HisB [Candidatus Bathyarchaeia archaeon]